MSMWCRDLSRARCPAVVLSRGAAANLKQTPISIPQTSLLNLPSFFKKQDLFSRWIDGTLVIAQSYPSNHRHPGQSLVLSVVRIPGLKDTSDMVAAELTRNQLIRAVDPRYWKTPGAGIIPIPGHGMFLIQADADRMQRAINYLATWHAWER